MSKPKLSLLRGHMIGLIITSFAAGMAVARLFPTMTEFALIFTAAGLIFVLFAERTNV